MKRLPVRWRWELFFFDSVVVTGLGVLVFLAISGVRL